LSFQDLVVIAFGHGFGRNAREINWDYDVGFFETITVAGRRRRSFSL